ncbi:MAG: hypothetical protein R3Y23_06940, partial [Bacillota bacterium]
KEKSEFNKNEYRFTYATNHIYAFNLNPQKGKSYYIKTMRAGNTDEFGFIIKDVKVVGSGASVSFAQTHKSLKINVAGEIDYTMPICFDVEVE